jgi:hypothetical protein
MVKEYDEDLGLEFLTFDEDNKRQLKKEIKTNEIPKEEYRRFRNTIREVYGAILNQWVFDLFMVIALVAASGLIVWLWLAKTSMDALKFFVICFIFVLPIYGLFISVVNSIKRRVWNMRMDIIYRSIRK